MVRFGIVGAYKQVDPRSAADARAHETLEPTTFHYGQRCDVGMLLAENKIGIPKNYFSSPIQLKSLEKPLSRRMNCVASDGNPADAVTRGMSA